MFSVGLVVVVSPLTGRDEALTSILGAAFRHGAVQALNERTNERIPSRPTDYLAIPTLPIHPLVS